MKISKQTKLFIVASLVFAALFFMGGDYILRKYGAYTIRGRNMLWLAWLALPTILVWFTAARLLMRREDTRGQRANLGLIYHAIVVAIAVIAWAAAYTWLAVFQPIDLAWIGALGGGSLVAHWLLTRNRAKGINSKKAFL